MKKLFIILVVSLLLVGCSSKKEETLDIGVAFFPMKEILELVEDDLKEAGITLNVQEFSDYQTPNNLLKDKELDANMIQHHYFLEEFNAANETELEVIMPIYHATFALYSKEYESLDEIPDGALITMPDDKTNFSRSLYLLHQAGLIEVDLENATSLTEDDILSNPKNLQFTDTVPLTSLAQRYVETELAVMYPTYALSLELEGDAERLYVESLDDVTEDYAISLVSRKDNKDSEAIKTLMEVLESDKVRDFLIENYDWASTPAF